MQIKKMNKKTYIKFIEFVFQTCNVVGFKKYNYPREKETNKIINIIKNNSSIEITYSKKNIKKLCSKFVNDSRIFEDEFKSYDHEQVIKGSIYNYLYNNATNHFLQKNKNNLIFKKENVNKGANYNISFYYFKLDNSIKKDIQDKNSIFEWHFPTTLEDICIFKKSGLCWLWSVSHEEIYEICFQEGDIEEYKYLKSIGVEFVEKEFTFTPKEYLYYLEDYIKDDY